MVVNEATEGIWIARICLNLYFDPAPWALFTLFQILYWVPLPVGMYSQEICEIEFSGSHEGILYICMKLDNCQLSAGLAVKVMLNRTQLCSRGWLPTVLL